MASAAASLLMAEIVLRLAGDIPGFLGPRPGEYLALRAVNRLVVEDTFYTDETGLFRAKPGPLRNDPAVIINAEGFRGAPFRQAPPGKTSVLFVGDSFVWGASARPLSESFVDRVARAGYHCWNTGIPGADPNQYALLAKRYVPRLRPDVVVVVFYMANDVMHERIELKPFQNRYHVTNAGWLNSFLDGEYIGDAQQTYDYYLLRYCIPAGRFRWLYASTAIGTRLYRLSHQHEVPPLVQERQRRQQARWQERPVSHEYLEEIRELCRQHGARFLLVVIPQHDRIGEDLAQAHPGLFRDLPWSSPDLRRSDYNEWPDGHLNNEGHRKVAEFVAARLAQSEMGPGSRAVMPPRPR